MRKEVPEVGWGDFEVLSTRDPAVLAIRYDWRNNSVLFVHNLDAIRSPGKHHLLLEAYGYRWYRVGGLDTCSNGVRSRRQRRAKRHLPGLFSKEERPPLAVFVFRFPFTLTRAIGRFCNQIQSGIVGFFRTNFPTVGKILTAS